MAYDLRLHEKAHEEYIAAYEWYEMSIQGLGDRFMNCVAKKVTANQRTSRIFWKKRRQLQSR